MAVTNDGLVQKLVGSVSRTAAVVKGGRIFSFRAVVVVGDKAGRIGMGIGKSREVPLAIQKALDQAKQSMMTIPLGEHTLVHAVIGYHGATKVVLLPAPEGSGVVAGSGVRAVCEVIGLHNVIAKCIGSTNPMNVVRATLNGLLQISTPEIEAQRRKVSVHHILNNYHAAGEREQEAHHASE